MFKNQDVICFLGDSITANGLYVAEVYQTLRKKYKLKCFNCGVSGADANSALKYFYSNCLIYNPDYVVIAFGINDIYRHLYGDSYKDVPNVQIQKQQALDLFAKSYEKLICQITDSGAKVIVCVPPPYDEVNDKEEENLHCQCGMDKIETIVLALADKYNCSVVNYKKVMWPILTKMNIVSEDRVHPTDLGQHVMAQIFLHDIGEITDCDFDTPFEFEDWNLTRYNLEKSLHKTNFVDLGDLLNEGFVDVIPIEKRKKIAKAKFDECTDKNTFVALAYKEYLETIDKKPKILGEIVKHTIF